MLNTVAFVRIQSLKEPGKPKCFSAEIDEEMYSCREIQLDSVAMQSSCTRVRDLCSKPGLFEAILVSMLLQK